MSAKKMLLATGLMAVTLFTACNNHRDPDMDDYAVSTVNAIDARFMQNAAEANTIEIMTSKLAQSHYRNDMVATFAKMMISEHEFAQQQLMGIGAKTAIEVDNGNYLGPTNTKFYDSLKKMTTTGKSKTLEFDRTYMEMQKTLHEKAIMLSKAEASSGSNADIKNYAQVMLGTSEKHYRIADSILRKL